VKLKAMRRGTGDVNDQEWRQILPGWAGTLGDVEFPTDAIAAYPSYTWSGEGKERVQQARILVVTPWGLLAYDLHAELVREFPEETKGHVAATAVPISSVRSVRWGRTFTARPGRDARVHPGENILIELDQALGDWGKTLTLPVDAENDYGSPEDSRQAAVRFAEAVISALRRTVVP
jgi:hypothetical protein